MIHLGEYESLVSETGGNQTTDAADGFPALDVAPVATPASAQTAAEPMAVDEDDLLQQALAMSMTAAPTDTDSGPPAPTQTAATAGGSMFDSYDEELQNAIRMSMTEVQPGESADPDPNEVNFCSSMSGIKL